MDDDQEICRVCRSESTPDHPLYHPCKCSGSIRFVHEDCLIEWLSHSKKKYCELCEHPFTFSPIYRDDMPEKVPFYVVFSQLIHRFISMLKTCFRGLTVITVWLIILPNCTFWIWRFYFWSGGHIGTQVESSVDFNANSTGSTFIPTSGTDPYLPVALTDFLSNCLEGQIITAFVIIVFVAAYLFREWVLQNLPVQQHFRDDIENNNMNDEQPGQEQMALDVLDNAIQVLDSSEHHDNAEQQLAANPLRRQLIDMRAEYAANSGLIRDQDDIRYFMGSNRFDFTNDDLLDVRNGAGPSSSMGNSYSNDIISVDDDMEEDYEEEEDHERHYIKPEELNHEEILSALRLQDYDHHFNRHMIGHDDEDRHHERQEAELERQNIARQPIDLGAAAAAAAAAVVEDDEPLDAADDINGVLEAIGMRGNPWMLVQNSILLAIMISGCLGVAVWIPYVIGRLVILIRPTSFIETPIYIMRLITDPLVDFVLDLCLPFIWSLTGEHVKSIMPENIQLAIQSIQEQFSQSFQMVLSNATTTTTAITASATVGKATQSVPVNMTFTGFSADSVMMNMDWNMIQDKAEKMISVVLARWHRFAMNQSALDRSVCIMVGYLVLIVLGSWYLSYTGRRSTNAHGNGIVQDIIRQQGIFLKVLFFILIELVVFPTVCGFLLDMATLPLFANASLTSRYEFHMKSPYSSHFLHWFLGTGVLFYFAIFITVCREIIRPGVMWFIRDPNDPQFHPVQEMVERPFPNLLHKISQSALIYSVMLVFGVGTVTYSLAFTKIVFPLRLPFNAPLSTLAVDLLIIQFLLPPLIALIKPRDYSKKALDLWWHLACRQLRLTQFMFNTRQPDEEGQHIRRTLKAKVLFEKATVPTNNTDELSDVAIVNENEPVVFRRDGMLIRVPKYDSVPVDPKRRMLIPVDPVTLEPIDEQEKGRIHPAAADTNSEEQSTIVVYIPPYFKQRLIIFLIYMWFSISAFVCSVTVVPLLVGRILFKYYLAAETKVNDLYSFALGIYAMTAVIIAIRWGYEMYTNRSHANKEEITAYVKEKAGKVGRFVYFASVFGVIIPLLLGIAVDLFVFMPIRSFNSETGLVIYVSQNWSFGVAYMSIIHNLIHVLPVNNRLRQKLNEVTGDGLMQTDLLTITRTLIAPVIITAVLAIITPGIASWGILQMLDSKDPLLQITITRYAYPIVFCFFMTLFSGYVIKKLVDMWMQIIRDDTYLIGKKLHNLKNDTPSNNQSSDNSSSVNSSSNNIQN